MPDFASPTLICQDIAEAHEPRAPLREAIRELRDRSMSLDIYVWLALRLHSLSKGTPISWTAAHARFGAGYAKVFRVKAMLTGSLAAISSTSNPLIRKLSHFAPLSGSDRQVLDALAGRDELFPADVDIVSEGSVPRSVFLLKEGMAIRYRSLPDGGRQIMTFLIPGDLCDMHVFLLKAMDHSIGTITPVRVAPISRKSMMDLFSHRPRISAAL